MEGTRHEKVGLIIASYVIGFVTAFIAFGQAKMTAPEPIVVIQREVERTTSVAEASQPTTVGFNEDGLYAITPQGERIISANRNVLSASAVESLPGYFYNIIDAEPSRDGSFVYFCEQLTEESESCDSYVYSVAADTLYRVTVDGEAYSPAIAGHNSMWGTQNELSINGALTMDLSHPWLLESAPEVVSQ
jgi:hypothetical protein